MRRYGSKEFPVKRNSETTVVNHEENFDRVNSLQKENSYIHLMISRLSERASANQHMSAKTELDDFILSLYQVDRKYIAETYGYSQVSELKYLNRDKSDIDLFDLNIEEIRRLDNGVIKNIIGAKSGRGGLVVVRAVIEPQWLDIAILKVNECYPTAKINSLNLSDLEALVKEINLYWLERRW